MVAKRVDFSVGGSTGRVQFRVAGVERFRRTAPSP
jgi:hypothetical protein